MGSALDWVRPRIKWKEVGTRMVKEKVGGTLICTKTPVNFANTFNSKLVTKLNLKVERPMVKMEMSLQTSTINIKKILL